jgi:indoleamine 2,3-dioxygenase
MNQTPTPQFQPTRGFLPAEDPLRRLPPAFAELENLGQELPKLLLSAQPRQEISRLGPLPLDLLSSRAELERAMMILSFLGHGYIWGEKETITSIPASIAVPWVQLARRLERSPSLVYASYALHNWRRFDPQRPPVLGNICLLQNFLGGIDEEWFVLIHIDVEHHAAPAIAALVPLQQAAQRGEHEEIRRLLELIAQAVENMNTSMDRMPEHCDPYIYYQRVRPYIHGWKNNPALPDGLVYEGVNEYGGLPQQFRGETGSQSSIIPCLDAALGVVHKEDQLAVYLREMREYMPQEHRAFLEHLEQAPSTRTQLLEHHHNSPGIRDAYNACIKGIDRFRMTHLKYAARYIEQQVQTDSTNPNEVGTGGTPFMRYLSKHQKETAQHLI